MEPATGFEPEDPAPALPRSHTPGRALQMPRITFTVNLRRHLDTPTEEVPGRTVREVLDAVFSKSPRLRGFILDDQGELRQHVVVFVDGAKLEDRRDLSRPVREASQLYVMQALSGGQGR